MAKGFLISGWLLRVLDANGDPPGSAFPFQVAFFDASTQTPATVYNDVECAIALGPVVALDAEGYAPDGGVWGEVGKSYKAVVSRVLSSDMELPDNERLEVLYTINGIGEAETPAVPEGSGVSVSGMAALRLIVPPDDGLLYFLSGYYAMNDGGQGWFRWAADSYEADDGGYSVRPDSVSSGEAGRFVRVLDSELDVRWWGAIPDGVVDCAAPLMRCKAHAARIDLYAAPPRIVFPAGSSYYSIPGAVVLGGSDGRGYAHTWRVKDGAQFGGFESMTVETNAIVESTGLLDVAYGRSVVFAPGSLERVDARWWSADAASLYNTLWNISEEFAPGIPIYVDSSATTSGVVSVPTTLQIKSPLVLGPGVVLDAGDGVAVTLSSVTVLGGPRKAFSGSSTGYFVFTVMPVLYAWMFGWGTSENSGAGLALAAKVAKMSAMDSVLEIDGAAAPGFSASALDVVADCGAASVRVMGAMSIVSGGKLTCGAILNASGIRCFLSTLENPVSIANGISHASWFGSSDMLHVRQAVNALANTTSWEWSGTVDLDGGFYSRDVGDSATVGVYRETLTIRNGRLRARDGSAHLVSVFSNDFRMENVHLDSFSAFSGALVSIDTPADDASASQRSGFELSRCRFEVSGGAGMRIGGNRADYATRDVLVDACRFEVSMDGAVPFVIPSTSGADGVRFRDCRFSGLRRTSTEWRVFGEDVSIDNCEFSTASTVAAVLRWKGSSGFRFTRNRADKLGVALEAFADVVVSDNRFTTQGVVWLGCQYNGQKFEGTLVERNTFELMSVEEWPAPVFVWQALTLDAHGNILAGVTAFDWTPNTLRLRIADNATNLGFIHQTKLRVVVYGNFVSSLIPMAHFCFFYRVGQADKSTITTTVSKSSTSGNGFAETTAPLELQQIDILLSLYGEQPLPNIKQQQ